MERQDNCAIGRKLESIHAWWWVDSDNNKHEEEGLHLICDGGYHPWKTMIFPFKFGDDTDPKMRWSKHVESLRKDVECVFGILKKRFMVLKYAMRFRDIETIGKVFRTCCRLHNMLLKFDGYDDWSEFVEEDVDVENSTEGRIGNINHESYMRVSDHHLVDVDIGDEVETNDDICQSFSRDDFDYRRDALI